MADKRARRRVRAFTGALLAGMLATTTLLVGSSVGSSGSRGQLTTVTVNTLPIANGFPLDVGIAKGFFEKRGIEIKKVTFQSGNDIILALANNNGDIGYIGWVPAFIAATSGIDIVTAAASETEATSVADNWQNVMVKGSSSIKTPADLAGKSIAVNALKGVAETVIKGALDKLGVDPNSVKLVPIPFPAMRTALANGQVDAAHMPEPFMSQTLNDDGGRIVLAPGPAIMQFLPNGVYVARGPWARQNPALARNFRLAMNESLTYSQSHPDEVRALLPAAIRNIRLAVWSPVLDRKKLLQLAIIAKKFGVISRLPDLTKLVPGTIASGVIVKGDVGAKTISLRLDKQAVKTLTAGTDTFVVSDRSAKQNFHLKGPGVNKKTGTKKVGRITWTIKLKNGKYQYYSDTNPKLKGSFKVG
jgi:NitT/TauT family transport system substrate-binding protein